MPGGKDYSALQNEQLLKQELFTFLYKEHISMDNYKFLFERRVINATANFKSDCTIRVDAVVEVSSKSLFDVF